MGDIDLDAIRYGENKVIQHWCEFFAENKDNIIKARDGLLETIDMEESLKARANHVMECVNAYKTACGKMDGDFQDVFAKWRVCVENAEFSMTEEDIAKSHEQVEVIESTWKRMFQSMMDALPSSIDYGEDFDDAEIRLREQKNLYDLHVELICLANTFDAYLKTETNRRKPILRSMFRSFKRIAEWKIPDKLHFELHCTNLNGIVEKEQQEQWALNQMRSLVKDAHKTLKVMRLMI